MRRSRERLGMRENGGSSLPGKNRVSSCSSTRRQGLPKIPSHHHPKTKSASSGPSFQSDTNNSRTGSNRPSPKVSKVIIPQTTRSGNVRLGDDFKPLPPIVMSKKSYAKLGKLQPNSGPKQIRDSKRLSIANVKMPMARIQMATKVVGNIEKISCTNRYISLHKLKEAMIRVTNHLASTFEIEDVELVRKILSYAFSLKVPGTSVVDQNTFRAQMRETFDILDLYLIDRIFHISQSQFSNALTVEEFARVVCIFLSPHFVYQAMFAFNVYDVDNNNKLGRPEFAQLLRPCVAGMFDDDEGDELTSSSDKPPEFELALMVLGLFGKSWKEPDIDRFEWYEAVSKDRLLSQCLGQCLPRQRKLNAFVALLNSKEPYELADYFQHERKRCLQEPELPNDHVSLYPVLLELG